MSLLGLSFFIVALFYAGVGFGGGSSYLALLVLWQVPFMFVPVLALLCNILVVGGNSFRYGAAGFWNKPLILPSILASVPCAYLGGLLALSQAQFLWLLFLTLLLAGGRLLLTYRFYDEKSQSAYRLPPLGVSLGLGAGIGFLSGAVGIGGGIFLAPILYNLRAAPPKEIAMAASVFILVNSSAGLVGQVQKTGISSELFDYWFLPVLVLLGGALGNFLTIRFIPQRYVALLTALLILFVAARLAFDLSIP